MRWVLVLPGKTKGETAVACFARAGYLRVEPAVLHRVAPFLDLSGEDIRRRMFVTQDGDGVEWCLRPEYTIPVALAHIAGQGVVDGAAEGAYAYSGPVFRLRSGEPGEFAQAGLESFGREDRTAADAEVMGLTLEAVEALGLSAPVIRMGDPALLGTLLERLAVPAAARRRLMRALVRGDSLDAALAALDPPAAPGSDHAGLLAALEGQDPGAAKAFVEDVLSIAGISTVGGRSARDIAERFLARAADRDAGVPAELRQTVARLLAIAGDPDAASAALRALTAEAGLDASAELDAFDERTGFLAARGLDVAAIGFSVSFARNLDYYSGFVFELTDSARPAARPVAGGGRYDGLIRRLGGAADVPAVGASIWLDRLPGGTVAEGKGA